MITNYSFDDFDKQFPNDDACLDFLFKVRYGKKPNCLKCGEKINYKRVKDRKSYQCQITKCQYQVYPMAKTPFRKSTKGLRKWFLAMYLHHTSKDGIAAMELKRGLGISYPTAFRMSHKIKSMMATKTDKLFGIVEIDETFIGGLAKNMHYKKRQELFKGRRGAVNKTIVFGMLQRGGPIIAKIVENTDEETLLPIIRAHVDKSAIIVTDGHKAYSNLHKYFAQHIVVDHTRRKYTNGEYSTNTIEGFWSQLKRMLKTHIHVSKKHLQKYVDEAVFKYENRDTPIGIFQAILRNLAD